MSVSDSSSTAIVTALLITALLALSAAPAAAQDDAAAGASDPNDPSRETDISEDNYRRYMELKDARLERPAFPTTVFRPPSSLQKMGQLPESSQKHLRNQLRGIILQNGPWTPEEIGKEYRFTPSQAAQRDGELLVAEAEAWAELVGEYHEREAASLAEAGGQAGAPNPAEPQSDPQNASADESQSQALAGGPEGSNSGAQGNGQEQSNGGQQGADGDSNDGKDGGASASSSSASRRAAANESWQDPAAGPEAAMSTEGVAQSASELLRERGLARDGGGSAPPATANEAQAAEASGRWGDEYRSLLPPADTSGTATAEQAPATPAPVMPGDPGYRQPGAGQPGCPAAVL